MNNVLDTSTSHLNNIINFRVVAKTLINNKYVYNKDIPLLFRSGNTTAINKATAEMLINKHGITCNIDLRSTSEILQQNKPNNLIEAGIRWVNFPIQSINDSFKNILYPTYHDYFIYYSDLIENNINTIRDLITYLIYHQDTRFLINCHAGKDRTGIIAAIILSLCGVKRDIILNDYTLSSKYLLNNIKYFEPNWMKRNITQQEYSIRLIPKQKTMSMLLNKVNTTYGSIANWLMVNNLSSRDIEEIKNKFYLYKNIPIVYYQQGRIIT